jgi:transcriptional regulator with XRE-family HTH domain
MNNGQYLKEMGARIKAIRESKGLYLRDLGKMCNLHYGAICEIENGKRNAYVLTLKIIAEKLGVDVKDFL